MFKYLLQNDNINWMAILALITFVAIFIIGAGAILWRSREYIDKMSRLPLEEDDDQILIGETNEKHEK
jgi:hypothetical protein